MVLETGFIPGSSGSDLGVRWAGLALLFLMLTAMAVWMKMYGYKESDDLCRRHESGGRRHYVEVETMTSTAAWLTSIGGCAILCVFWWINMNIGVVDAALKEVLR